ncbi:MAG TPA: hypothetical protein VGE07_27825 [Herpetosiphonaceae bacterium]
MTIDEALADLSSKIKSVAPEAVLRTKKRNAEEGTIRAYVKADLESAVREAVQERSLELLTKNDLDVQVLVYDIETSLPPEEGAA